MKKFRLFKVLSIFAIAAAGAVAVGVGTKAPKVEAVSAEAASSDTEIYVDATTWSDANAKVQLYVFGNGLSSTWLKGTDIGGDVYRFVVPAKTETMIAVRMNPSGPESSWGGKWNQTNNIAFKSSANLISITSLDGDWCTYIYNSFVKHYAVGDKVYIDAENDFWYSDNAKSYFYTAFDGAGITRWNQMTRVGSSNVSKYVFSEDTYCTVVVVTRGSSGSWNTTWNQTNDINFTNENKTWNAFKLGANSDKVAVTGMELFSDDYLVNSFAYYFLNSTQNYCSAEITNTSEIAGVLDSLSAEGTAVKSTFASATISHTEGGHATYADNALSRYWNMTHESDHGKGSAYSDFLGLGLTFMSSSRGLSEITLFKSNDSTLVILIVVISLASISALAGLLFIRKRKHI